MSVKGTIFKQLALHLMEQLQFDQVITEDNPSPIPDLKWVDKQMGQFNNPEMFHLVPLPAILIGFRRTDWSTENRREQKGNAVISFWVHFENYADSFQGSLNQDKALQFFEFNERTHQALQGLSGDLFTQLERISDEDDEDHDMIIGTIFEYTTTITDSSADEYRKYTSVIDKEPAVKKVGIIERIGAVPLPEEDDNDFIV